MNKIMVLFLSLVILLSLVFFIVKTMQPKKDINELKNIVETKIQNPILIQSSAFENYGAIPRKYTCDGQSLIPPIQVSNVPSEAKSLAFTIEDPDAPSGTWDHFVMWNLPAKDFNTTDGNPPVGTIGKGTSGKAYYIAPCPPRGQTHRYFFRLYVLDTLLNIPASSNKIQLLKTIEGHVIGKTEMYGTYSRN
ncbi:MAG: YbhB/YbcL family Raf kinase inhibitor-like protein [Candidatus Paceibacterota bacterium]|jgi:hypothetical protein